MEIQMRAYTHIENKTLLKELKLSRVTRVRLSGLDGLTEVSKSRLEELLRGLLIHSYRETHPLHVIVEGELPEDIHLIYLQLQEHERHKQRIIQPSIDVGTYGTNKGSYEEELTMYNIEFQGVRNRLIPLHHLLMGTRSYTNYQHQSTHENERYYELQSDINIDFTYDVGNGGRDWDIHTKQRYIHTLLMGQPLGVFCINRLDIRKYRREGYSKEDLQLLTKYDGAVYDGRERLRSILEYIENRYGIMYKGDMIYYRDIKTVFNRVLHQEVHVTETAYDNITDIINAYSAIHLQTKTQQGE